MRYILLVFLTQASLFSYCQLMKGDKFLGGSVSLGTQRAPETPVAGSSFSNSFSISPGIGFLLNEKLAIGGQLGYSGYYSKSVYTPYTNVYKYSSGSAGIFGKRYFALTNQFYFTLVLGLSFSHGSQEMTDTNTATSSVSENKSTSYSISSNFRPTFLFFPSPHWAIDASFGGLGYTFSKNLTYKSNSNSFNLNYGFISLGLYYYFNKAAASKANP